MTIPDNAVYTAVPILAGMALWIAKSFVHQIASKAKRTTTVTTTTSVPAAPTIPAHVELTLTDFTQISDLLKKELNGRYMFAEEARKQFKETREQVEALETKLDNMITDLKDYIAEISAPRDSATRTRSGD